MKQIKCKLWATMCIILKIVSRFDVLDASVESMMSYMLSVWGCITLKNTWVSVSQDISQNWNFCSDPLTYDPICQIKNNRW